jgi:hypothetical protein
MSSKYSIIKRLPGEKVSKKRISRMSLTEFRYWKYRHLNAAFGFKFDMDRVNDVAYMNMIRPSKVSEIRGSSKGYSRVEKEPS